MPMDRKVIAVIDDDLDVLAAMESLLSALGYETEVYASATEFIDAVAKSDAACLIADIQLGDITGVEMARHLVALGFTFPIIFITGSDDPIMRKQAIEVGCVAYLQKPCPDGQLAKAIIKAIGVKGMC